MQGKETIHKQQLEEGILLLQQPILPLISMVQFLFFTGPFRTVDEVICEMPSPIETLFTTYKQPKELLLRHKSTLQLLEGIKTGEKPPWDIIGVQGEQVDAMSAISAIVQQQILTKELEKINSLLCAPCKCNLCCVGPDDSMQQDFFEIPLQKEEPDLFPVEKTDTPESQNHGSMDSQPLQEQGVPFYQCHEPVLVHWQNGWSLILPKGSACPNLDHQQGRCLVYTKRPEVCRRPQIFPYILEKTGNNGKKLQYRFRQSLLAIVDCPYVNLLQDEIAAYGAASELEVLFKQNKA